MQEDERAVEQQHGNRYQSACVPPAKEDDE